MKKLVQVMVVAMVGFLGAGVAQATLLLSDNFNFTGTPDSSNGYGLNEQLNTRQSGILAPMTYTRISGSGYAGQEGSVVVNGSLNLIGPSENTNPGVSIGPFGAGDYTLSVRGGATSSDWISVTLLAAADPAATGLTANSPKGGVSLLVNTVGIWAGYWDLFMGGTVVASGSGIPTPAVDNITISLSGSQSLVSINVNGDHLVTSFPVTSNQGDYVWLGYYGNGTGTFNDLEITVPEPSVLLLGAVGALIVGWVRRVRSKA